MPYGIITKIKNIRKHSNADRLMIGQCFGNQVIVDLNTKVNTLGVYFSTDTQLSEEYAKVNDLVRRKDELGNNVGGYLEPEKRHIRSLKLRGEISDGLFMPLDSLSHFGNIDKLSEGDVVDVFNGNEICGKYIPRVKHSQGTGTPKSKKKRKEGYPLFHQHKDTSQLAYNMHRFKKGDLIILTLKMHGTSQRTTCTYKSKSVGKLKNSILRMMGAEPKKTYETVTGTRRVNLDFNQAKQTGYYGNNTFRMKHHDFFDGKLRKGETVYYEVLGWAGDEKTIMPVVANKKMKDKAFTKMYGEKTTFSYGCEKGQSRIAVYRMTMTNIDGEEVDYTWDVVKKRAEEMGAETCPEFERFFFTTKNMLTKKVDKYLSGADPVGKTHVREGVVVRIDNAETFTAFKHKNIEFKILEGIIKTDDVVDMEEAEDAE